MKHDLASVFHCSPLELDKLPHAEIEKHYAIMVARDKKSRSSPAKNG